MEDKDGTFCLAQQQPKAFPETEAGVMGDSVLTTAGAKPAHPLAGFSPHSGMCVLLPTFLTLSSCGDWE